MYICVCVCVPLNACVLFVCIVHSHTSGYVCSATPLVFVWRPAGFISQGDLQWLFPRPDCSYSLRACTIPNTALECCWLHFFLLPFCFLSPFLCFCFVLLLFWLVCLFFLYDFSLLNLFSLFQFCTDFN